MSGDLFQGFQSGGRTDPSKGPMKTADAEGRIHLNLGDKARTLLIDDSVRSILVTNKLIDLGKSAFKHATEAEQVAAGFGIHIAATVIGDSGRYGATINVRRDDGEISDELLKLFEIASKGGAVGSADDNNLRLATVQAATANSPAIVEIVVDGRWSSDVLRFEGDIAAQLIDPPVRAPDPSP